jgi:RsiW-degrading membrane proteinase PrsW (M82 family)
VRRPIGITVVAAVTIPLGILWFASGLLGLHDFPVTQRFVFGEPKTWVALARGFPLIWGIAWTAAGIGLWRLRKWARRLTIFLCLLAMIALSFIFLGPLRPHGFRVESWSWYVLPLLIVVFYVLCLCYMLTVQVKRACSV